MLKRSVCIGLAVSMGAVCQGAEIVGLPDFTESVGGISGDGLVVVGNRSGPFQALRWTEAEGILELPGGSAVAASVNGDYVVTNSNSGPEEALRWSSDTDTFIGLGTLPGAVSPSNRPTGISADGSVVVGWDRSAVPTVPFIWTEQSLMRRLPGLTRTSTGEALGVSGDGNRVAGWSSDAGIAAAVHWDIDSQTVTRLPDLPGGGDESRAMAASADGRVIVGWGTSERGQEAFRWTEGEGIIGLGELPGGRNRSLATDVSGDGSIVVGWSSCSSSECSGNQPFIWDAEMGMRPVTGFLADEHGLDLTGWTFDTSVFISDDGRRLAGSGTFNGNGIGWWIDLDAAGASAMLGDMNGDGGLDAFDVAPFELALADAAVAPAGYALAYPELDPAERGDVNQDGSLDAFDVSAFEALLAGTGGGATVPEPRIWIVIALGITACGRRLKDRWE